MAILLRYGPSANQATFSLDPETVPALERLAERWKTTRSAAVRRLISECEEDVVALSEARIAALGRLQDSMGLTETEAAKWISEVRAEHRTSAASRNSCKLAFLDNSSA